MIPPIPQSKQSMYASIENNGYLEIQCKDKADASQRQIAIHVYASTYGKKFTTRKTKDHVLRIWRIQ